MDKRSLAKRVNNPTNFGKGRFIDPVSAGLQHDLTPGQKVTGLNVPLSSFGNPAIDDLYRDLFWATYLYESRLKDVPPAGSEEVRMMLDWVLADPTFKSKTMLMVNRKLSCATSAYAMTEELLRAPEANEAMSGLGKAQQMENKADNLDDQADQQEGNGQDDQESEDQSEQDGGGNSDGEDEDGQDGQGGSEDEDAVDNDGNPYDEDPDDRDYDEDSDDEDSDDESDEQDDEQQSPDELREEAEDLREQASQKREKARQQLEHLTGSNMSKFGRAGAIGIGTDYGEKVGQFVKMWGVDEGEGMMLSFDQIKLIMEGLSSSGIGALTSLIGRVYGIASATMRGRFPAQIHVDQAGFTKSIMDMHPSERFKLTQFYPARSQAIEQWMERGLGGVTKTTQSAREGSFICMVDESGSMSQDEDGGTREEIAKALALGLARAARENGQEFVLGGFGSYGEVTDLIDSRTELSSLMQFATFMFKGGTSFDFALEIMMDVVDGMGDDDKYKSDLVLITDGECSISSATRDRLDYMKQTFGVRLFSLVVGSTGGGALQEVSDEMLEFDSVDGVASKLSGLIWQ